MFDHIDGCAKSGRFDRQCRGIVNMTSLVWLAVEVIQILSSMS
ncbi:hypothetical protein [Yersinia enterocolitica]